MIICPQCGKESTSEQYCDFCGFAFSDEERRENASNVVATPFEVGAQTKNSPASYEGIAREVPISFGGAIKQCFFHWGTRGRASRAEFWYWALFVFLAVVVPLVGGVLLLILDAETGGRHENVGFIAMAAAGVFGIVCIGPTFSVTVRRFHDVGLPGYPPYLFLIIYLLLAVVTSKNSNDKVVGILLCFIPFLLLFVAVVALCPGDEDRNKYGPPPVKRKANAKDKAKNEEASQ